MSDDVYVLALVGNSPAVLTELAWHLIQVQHKRIVGFEVWTTHGGDSSGDRALGRLYPGLVGNPWERLRAQVGPDRLPPLPATGWPAPPAEDDFRAGRHRRFSVGWLRDAQGRMDDVRTAEHAEILEVALHERLQLLQRSLPADLPLIGSLAGGRKTMSASLQSAFALHARGGDRLTHVLLRAEIEQLCVAPKGQPRRAYWFPDDPGPTLADEGTLIEGHHIPAAEQVEVYDVWFPPLRQLLAFDKGLQQQTLAKPLARAFADLRERSRAFDVLRLAKHAGDWFLQAGPEGEPYLRQRITHARASVLIAQQRCPPGTKHDAMVAWLQRESAWADTAGNFKVASVGNIKTSAKQRKQRFQDHLRELREQLNQLAEALPRAGLDRLLDPDLRPSPLLIDGEPTP